MDMSTKNKNISSTQLVYIGGIGFVFEVNQSHKHNLLSPDVIAFFDGVQESGVVTKDCVFPLGIPNTNLRQSIFQNIGFDWVVCTDGVFRKCMVVKCNVCYNNCISKTVAFQIDNSMVNADVSGVLSK